MEFIKIGLRGLADWWAAHPDTPREALVAAVMDLTWNGLHAQFAVPDA